MAPKYHPAPLSGRDREALSSSFDKARAMTNILPRSRRLLALSKHDQGSHRGLLSGRKGPCAPDAHNLLAETAIQKITPDPATEQHISKRHPAGAA
jgi:hypothetical protein